MNLELIGWVGGGGILLLFIVFVLVANRKGSRAETALPTTDAAQLPTGLELLPESKLTYTASRLEVAMNEAYGYDHIEVFRQQLVRSGIAANHRAFDEGWLELRRCLLLQLLDPSLRPINEEVHKLWLQLARNRSAYESMCKRLMVSLLPVPELAATEQSLDRAWFNWMYERVFKPVRASAFYREQAHAADTGLQDRQQPERFVAAVEAKRRLTAAAEQEASDEVKDERNRLMGLAHSNEQDHS